jgi:prolipoprotein diacylglyceryltransferase
MLVVDSILGPGKAFLTAAIFAGGIVGAALWAQWVEGSPALLRPLGFYGGMLGTIAAAFVAPFFGVSIWSALCAIVVAAPIIQAVGRLRCLVQGCCHGRRVDEGRGIRYTHPRSRVPRLTDLGGAPIYPTPLYSILWNGFIALALARLLLLESRTSMICGIYLILSGMGRFVEEAYRGEPQTRIVFGLRFYQWIAIATVIAGAVLTTVTGAPPISPPILHSASLAVAAACGIFAWFASGVDFPESSRRFARLT